MPSLLLIALLLPQTAAAHQFTAVGVTNGLEARVATSLLLDREGFLWVGSREGLFRYDGYEATAFLPETGNRDAISDADVRCVYLDSADNLWAGTYSGGLNRYDAATGTFSHFRHDSDDPGSVLDDSIIAIAEGPESGLWVATQKGLSRLNRATGQFEHFRHDAADPASLSANRVNSLYRGASGQLWIGTIGGGVNRWNPQNRSFARYDLAALSGGPAELNDIFSFNEDRAGRLWVGTRVGLVLLNPADGTARELPLPRESEYLPAITSMAADSEGRLWLGTLVHGVLAIDMQTLEWDAEYADHDGPGSHLENQPQMSLALSQDMLFVGTWGSGVYRTISHSTRFDLLGKSYNTALRDENITAVMATEEPGRPWLGTHDSGLQRADIASHLVEEPAELSDDLRNALVLGLARSDDGRQWAGTSRGLFSFDESGRQTGRLGHDPSNENGLGEDFVRSLLPDGSVGLWIGTDGSGLYYLEHAGSRLANFRHQAGGDASLSGDSITALLSGSRGRIWVGTRSNGLNLCRIENWACEWFSDAKSSASDLGHFHVTSLFRDRNGKIWVGTSGNGLNQVLPDAQGGVAGFRRWAREDGLLDDGIMAIAQDLDDSLWLSTRNGLSRLRPDTGQVINYVTESGLPTSLFNPGAAAADDRYIYFGSVHGLLSLPKGSSFAVRQPANVRITSIERALPGGENRAVFWNDDQLSVPYGEVLSIKLATLDLSESPHGYSYRLRADQPWIEMGTQRNLILHGLAPGLYEFKARSRDVFGSWGESATLRLEIVPPFWMSNTFRVAIGVLLLLAALTAHLTRQSVLKRRALEIQRLGEKREQALEERLGSEAELAVLTPRQKEVLQLIAEGLSMKEIAERLGVSVKTVEAHRANLMDRLGIHDVPGLVRLAIRSRLVSQYD